MSATRCSATPTRARASRPPRAAPRSDTFTYDGTLTTAAGEYTYGYADNTELESIQLAGAAKQGLVYDDDGFIAGYGPFTWERNGPLGDVSKITDEALALALSYDGLGQQRGRTLTVKGAKRYENTITRDDAGRISKRVETVNGTTKTYDYEYFPDGELKSVKDGATVLESYTYDANGNRAGRTYADDDRMTGTHVYDAAGFLVSRGADTFTYTDRGLLKTATVGGQKVDYEYDASDRLVARIHGGVRTEFLYGNPASPFRVTASRVGGQLTQYFYDGDGLLYRARARRRALLRRHRPGGHAARGHGRRRRGRQDVRDQRVRRAQPRRRDRHVRAAARLRGRHRGPGHRARALRPARLRAGSRAASPRRTRSCTRAA